jgi:hypothetical protein
MASKRELIEPHKGDKRYARRNPEGKFLTNRASSLWISLIRPCPNSMRVAHATT